LILTALLLTGLSALLATLPGLPFFTVLTRLIAVLLTGLSALLALLSIAFHIICHE
jgi:hypothetical protein